MKANRQSFAESVFFNCPFDDDYLPIFDAVVFTIVSSSAQRTAFLAAADAALARARAAGGNRVVVFDEESTLPG